MFCVLRLLFPTYIPRMLHVHVFSHTIRPPPPPSFRFPRKPLPVSRQLGSRTAAGEAGKRSRESRRTGGHDTGQGRQRTAVIGQRASCRINPLPGALKRQKASEERRKNWEPPASIPALLRRSIGASYPEKRFGEADRGSLSAFGFSFKDF